ncbi:MAG: hypothetical protein AAGI23_09415 [Bacteroidota bacterium]
MKKIWLAFAFVFVCTLTSIAQNGITRVGSANTAKQLQFQITTIQAGQETNPITVTNASEIFEVSVQGQTNFEGATEDYTVTTSGNDLVINWVASREPVAGDKVRIDYYE